MHGNFEGDIPGFGQVFGTLTLTSAGQKTGTWSWSTVSFAENGDSLTGNGQGTFSSAGTNRWRLLGFIHDSNGSTVRVESEFKLATRKWSGKFFIS
jgi:hypothetical protein